ENCDPTGSSLTALPTYFAHQQTNKESTPERHRIDKTHVAPPILASQCRETTRHSGCLILTSSPRCPESRKPDVSKAAIRSYLEIIDFIASGTTPEAVADHRPSPEAQRRIAELIAKEKEGANWL
ncbi:MAG TPA: hypothetical protein VME17_14280, partial [Bryobacteraceae bacterium]|nr:hypothetical protein [Bryobacteraceae bacterium]